MGSERASERRPRVVAAVALGSNLGDRARNLRGALVALERTPGVVVLRRSRTVETAPVGGPNGQGPFLNGVVLVETTLDARGLLAELQRIEAKYGRERDVPDGPRTLDLDLLLFGAEHIDEPDLCVPHPRMEERAFVLTPLAELLPDHVLAGSRKTVRERAVELGSPALMARLGDPAAAREWCRAARETGATLGFVPTMGALHEGHLALVELAVRENDLVSVSVFVNPLQFDDPGDLERYPRDFEGDADRLEAAGCSMVFTGTLEGFFPGDVGPDGTLDPRRMVDPGPAAQGLEGEHRPGHFAGVATIVDRLFDVVEPARAYFGQKDFQQVQVVRDLARRRGGPEIIVSPTVREATGLALSSRNARLDAPARAAALFLSRALAATDAAWRAGERDPGALEGVLRRALAEGGLDVEYAAVRDPVRWDAAATSPPERSARPESARPGDRDAVALVALVAARVGAVRLIDNHVLGTDPVPGARVVQPAGGAAEPLS